MNSRIFSFFDWRRIRRNCLLPMTALLLSVGLMSVQGVYAEQAEPAGATVNINVADAPTLAAGLKGVGLRRAEDIVRYREQYGPFTTVEQLAEVKGIGDATVETNRSRIALD